MDAGFFDSVAVEPIVLSTGMRLALPVRYRDWTAIMAHFPISAPAARAILPTGRLRPVELVPGTAILTLAAMEYRSIDDVEPYNEVGVMVPVRYEPRINVPALPLIAPERFEHFGLYVWHLPVTTQAAYDFGVEIWGYPKFIAEISFEDGPNARRCRLRADGMDILTLEVEHVTTSQRPIDFHSYTVKDDALLRTRIEVQGELGLTRLPGGASMVLGDHPIARDLRRLRIGREPVRRLYAPRIQSMLHRAGECLPL